MERLTWPQSRQVVSVVEINRKGVELHVIRSRFTWEEKLAAVAMIEEGLKLCGLVHEYSFVRTRCTSGNYSM